MEVVSVEKAAQLTSVIALCDDSGWYSDDNPFKPVLRERVARYGEMTKKLRDGELDAGNAVKAMQALEGVL